MCAYTYPEIGEKIGVAKQKVEIIHRRAIGKLQRTARRIKFNLEAI
jgi:DNA-directed RNA polymerase sigma subunit (sigma70/sigma32)